MQRLHLPLAALVLACTGCVAVPPPAPPPVAVAAPAAPAQAQQNCREFQQTVIVGGQPQQGYGTTCQQPDGSWQIVQQPQASAAPAPPPPVAAAPYPYPYPAYPYPYYYGYPGYVGPPVSVGLGFRFHVH